MASARSQLILVGGLSLALSFAPGAGATVARAAEPSDGNAGVAAHLGGQRNFGAGPVVGIWSGAGAIVGGGGEAAKAWLSGGYFPILVFANAKTPGRDFRFNGYNSAQINGDLSLRLTRQDRAELSLLGGYKFNTVIGHGGGAGLLILYDLGQHFALTVLAGLAVFPSALDRLHQNHGYPYDRDPKLPWLQGGASVGLLFYP